MTSDQRNHFGVSGRVDDPEYYSGACPCGGLSPGAAASVDLACVGLYTGIPNLDVIVKGVCISPDLVELIGCGVAAHNKYNYSPVGFDISDRFTL